MYLSGGLAPGRVRHQSGARDQSRWRNDVALELPHRLLFGGRSKSWGGGGFAMVDPTVADRTTLARGYLITVQQFQDVLAQESWRDIGDEVDLAAAIERGSSVIGSGHYDLVLCVGHRGGHPMLTFTTPKPIHHIERNAPVPAYEATIVAGLRQSHGLSERSAKSYIRDHVVADTVHGDGRSDG